MEHISQLLKFYYGVEVDDRGRFLQDILQWDYGRLECVHDFIQWLFPLIEHSAFNWSAPVLTREDVESFRNSEELKYNLTRHSILC